MCIDCGCGTDEVSINGVMVSNNHEHGDGKDWHQHSHKHPHAHSHDHHHDGHHHTHPHEHSHEHMHTDHAHHHEHLHDAGDAHDDHTHDNTSTNSHNHDPHEHHEHSHGEKTTRTVKLEQDVLAKNNIYAEKNRLSQNTQGIFSLNFVSSPGSGKTTFLVKTIEALKDEINIAVIEGDQQTDNDAQKIRATGVNAIQINTGKGCHLDAHMVGHATENIKPTKNSLLFIENVGNLVCPAAFDLGEDHKVVILSVTEGEDKPLKYPDMFRAADLMLLNKSDLLPYLDFEVEQAINNAKRVNPKIEIIQISAKSGEGFDKWLEWLRVKTKAKAV